ncbi:serine/threonine-protein phosphatase 7 long form homolog [Chenopodium quinoa]|uniref:serine/threonine-protein phosphatase 7 long form homolog n=1 Tax=Chenopodium quinoa TaxID=63459 RepID=UPI000B77B39E|nr:serine/threonine-protein phosphatase 7 long form homolog [Chenopodium quinoa]
MEGQDQGQTRHDPGPADPSVLTLQDTHRSRDIWEQIETHSFHLPVGEATVTLRDVAILTRFLVHGRAVTRPIIQDPRGLVERVLGVRPEATDVRGTGLRHIWLRETFGVLPPDADDGVVQRYARAYLFMLIGSLFSNKSGSHIQLIYLQLASQRSRWEISGPLIVLQVVLWLGRRLTRVHAARGLPYYRDAFDRLSESQMTWDPYVPHLVDDMPQYLLDHQMEWRAMTVLICFELVEAHLPDRVMRQFGLCQAIPAPCDTSVQLHRTDRRGKGKVNWAVQHAPYIDMWDQRLQHVADGAPVQGLMEYHDPYMVWYRSITRRFINPNYTPPLTHYHPAFGDISGYASDMLAIHDALEVLSISYPTIPQLDDIHAMTVSSLQRHGHGHLIPQGRDQSHRRSHREVGSSSRGQTHTSPTGSPLFFDDQEDIAIHMFAPYSSQEGPSSSQQTPPQTSAPDPFTTVSQYYRRRRPRLDRQHLHTIDESRS